MEDNNYTYRRADKKDIIKIAALVTKLLGTCNLNKDNSIMENNIIEITNSINHYHVCEVNGNIIGACGLSGILERDNYNLDLCNIKEILYLVVDEKHQGKGIGTTLLNLCCDNQKEDIIYEAWGDNEIFVNSKFVLEKCKFELYKDLGNEYYKSHNYCTMCVNRNNNCNNCLAQIWLKKGSD